MVESSRGFGVYAPHIDYRIDPNGDYGFSLSLFLKPSRVLSS